MELFMLIALICLLLTFSGDIVKVFRNISNRWIRSKGYQVPPQLQQRLNEAQSELENVQKNYSSFPEYAFQVRTLRAQERVSKIKSEIEMQRVCCNLKSTKNDLMLNYGLKGILSLCLIVISIRNRYTPALVFDSSFNFMPFGGIMSFPTGVSNAVSVPMWIWSCNSVFRLAHSIVLSK